MEYAKIEKGTITDLISTATPPEGKGWREVDGAVFEGAVGMADAMIDWKTGRTHPVEELIADGLVEDNRGHVYNTETMEAQEIVEVGQAVPEGYTTVAPPSGEEFCRWDAKTSAWSIDEDAKKLSALNTELAEREGYLRDTDWYSIRENETRRAAEVGADESLIKETPPAILKRRQGARDRISALRLEIDALEEKIRKSAEK